MTPLVNFIMKSFNLSHDHSSALCGCGFKTTRSYHTLFPASYLFADRKLAVSVVLYLALI